MGMQLSDVHLSILSDASDGKPFRPCSKYEEQLVAQLQVHNYMDSSNRITQLGRGALKGQGWGKL